MRYSKIALYILLAYQFLDGLLTYAGLKTGIDEGNPIGRMLFDFYGPVVGIILIKGLIILVVALLLRWAVGIFDRSELARAALIACMIYGAVVIFVWSGILILDQFGY